jgi:two-component system cell cycle response regulator
MTQSKILIVDDNKITLKLIKKYLEGNDFDVTVANDGEECISIVHSWKPDIILLDVMMPKLDGYETIKRLKADENTKDIPVIIVTALNDVTNQVKSIKSGADDFLSKPIEEKLLISKIKLFTELACEKKKNRELQELLDIAIKQGFNIEQVNNSD